MSPRCFLDKDSVNRMIFSSLRKKFENTETGNTSRHKSKEQVRSEAKKINDRCYKEDRNRGDKSLKNLGGGSKVESSEHRMWIRGSKEDGLDKNVDRVGEFVSRIRSFSEARKKEDCEIKIRERSPIRQQRSFNEDKRSPLLVNMQNERTGCSKYDGLGETIDRVVKFVDRTSIEGNLARSTSPLFPIKNCNP